MAAKQLDVWIVESDTVYREVPYTVVTDWLQQGRLLGDDRVRLAGQRQWHTIASIKSFAPYLPRAEPMQADDRAEALEPVALGFDWKRPGEAEDEDVDMIPLIDISLVLLIFFMMTASVTSGILSAINTPGAKHQLATITSEMLWIGVEPSSRAGAIERGPDGQPLPWYSLGRDVEELQAPTTDARAVLDGLFGQLANVRGEVKVRIRADRDLPIETIKGVTLELQGIEARINRDREPGNRVTLAIVGEVSEPQGSP
jgi:biopolymer transport protein ExbD